MIGAVFIVFVVGGIFYTMARDNRPEDFPAPAKWFLGIIGVVALFILLGSLFGAPPKYKGYDRSPDVNYCTLGAKLDKFQSGGGQWRNPDGRFCKKY